MTLAPTAPVRLRECLATLFVLCLNRFRRPTVLVMSVRKTLWCRRLQPVVPKSKPLASVPNRLQPVSDDVGAAVSADTWKVPTG